MISPLSTERLYTVRGIEKNIIYTVVTFTIKGLTFCYSSLMALSLCAETTHVILPSGVNDEYINVSHTSMMCVEQLYSEQTNR